VGREVAPGELTTGGRSRRNVRPCVSSILRGHVLDIVNYEEIAISGQFRWGLCAAGATADALAVQRLIAKPLIRADLLAAVRDMIGKQP
jgi:hypothetical protein